MNEEESQNDNSFKSDCISFTWENGSTTISNSQHKKLLNDLSDKKFNSFANNINRKQSMPSHWINMETNNIELSIKKMRKQSENIVFNSIDGWKKKTNETNDICSNSIDLSSHEPTIFDLEQNKNLNFDEKKIEFKIKGFDEFLENQKNNNDFDDNENNINLNNVSPDKEIFRFSLNQQNLEIEKNEKNNSTHFETPDKNLVFKNIASNIDFKNTQMMINKNLKENSLSSIEKSKKFKNKLKNKLKKESIFENRNLTFENYVLKVSNCENTEFSKLDINVMKTICKFISKKNISKKTVSKYSFARNNQSIEKIDNDLKNSEIFINQNYQKNNLSIDMLINEFLLLG